MQSVDKNKETEEKLRADKEALLSEIKKAYGHETPEETDSETKESIENESQNPNDETNDPEITSKNEDDSSEEETDSRDSTPVTLSKATSMPKYGKSFIFMPIVIGVTILAIILGHIKPFSIGVLTNHILRYSYIGIGVIVAVIGINLFVEAVSACDILTNAQLGNLITTGIYAKTRNPMYGGIIFMCAGALFISGNVYTFVLPVMYWGFLVALMNNTEEPLLEETFGKEYIEYKKKTHRFLPLPKSDTK